MKRITKLFCCLILLTLSIIGLSSCNKNNNQEIALTRTGKIISYGDEYFDSVVETNNDDLYKTVAKKKISSDALEGFESVSLYEDEYLITYEVCTNLSDRTVVLNVYFDSTNEHIIENFTGVPMINYSNEEDILFTIDSEHIFLSELNNLSSQEQCSWFGNALHKVLNADMQTLSYIEPSIKILVFVKANILERLYNIVKNVSYISNYKSNSKKAQPQGYVYGQGSFSDWKFGYSNMAYAGCEVIAGYNLAHAIGRDFTLADTIFLYESLGIEIGIAQGFFGSNPYQISYFLNSTGISYNKVTNYKTFKKYMENKNDYYVILSRWNGESAKDMIHTFMIDKDSNYGSNKYHAYNYYSKENVTTDVSDYNKYFEGRINKTYICAYFVSK